MLTSDASPTNFTFKKCLWLSAPALLVGLVVRLMLLSATPESYYGADSNSYFNTARAAWVDQGISFNPKRRFFYPLLLALTPPLPGSPAQAAAVIQHLIFGLGTVCAVGWITGNVTRFPSIWVPPVTIAAALWPRMFWHEHEMIAETMFLASFAVTTALAFPIQRLLQPQRLFYFLIGLATIVGTKPHGRPCWLGLLIAALFVVGSPLKWSRKNMMAGAFSIVLIFATGSSSQGDWLLMTSALPLIDPDGKTYSEYRQMLRPWIETTRADLPNYCFEQQTYKKPLGDEKETNPLGPKYRAMVQDKELFSDVTKTLSREAILSHPIEFATIIFRKAMKVMASPGSDGRFQPAEFWRRQESLNKKRWDERPAEMQVVYGMNRQGYEALVAERSKRTFALEKFFNDLAQHVVWTVCERGAPNQTPTIRPTWLGALFVFGLFASFVPSRIRRTVFISLPAMIYLFLVFAVGDAVQRYLQPVEWVLIILCAVGLDLLASTGFELAHRRNPAPALTATARTLWTDRDQIVASSRQRFLNRLESVKALIRDRKR